MRWWALACLLGLARPVVAAAAADGQSVTNPSGGKSAAALPASTPADPMAEARALVKTLYDTAAFIERLQERTAGYALRASCVTGSM